MRWLSLRQIKIDKLELIGVAATQDVVLAYLEQHGSFVREIALGKDFDMDDTLLSVITHFTTGLERLQLGPNNKITETVFSFISDYCPRLSQLSYIHAQDGCMSLDFMRRFSMRNLNQLTLKDCALISTDRIISLARDCRNLVELSLINCTWSTSALRLDQAYTPAALKKLTLRACRCLVLPSILAILSSCGELEELNMQQCRLLSSNAPPALMPAVEGSVEGSRTKGLRVLDLTGTNNIDRAAVLVLVRESCDMRKLSLHSQRCTSRTIHSEKSPPNATNLKRSIWLTVLEYQMLPYLQL